MTQICNAFTQKNICCTNTAHKNGLCKMHSKKTYDECSICYDNIYVKETVYTSGKGTHVLCVAPSCFMSPINEMRYWTMQSILLGFWMIK